jgi:hypothetical protein
MIRKLLFLSVSALSVACMNGAMAAGITYPEAPGPNPDQLIVPPQENPYYYVRPDKQAFVLAIDSTNNMTDFLNRHWYDRHWNGVQWSPWDAQVILRKGERCLAIWPEYNQFSQLGVCNGWHRFFEVYSGFGPGPGFGSLK